MALPNLLVFSALVPSSTAVFLLTIATEMLLKLDVSLVCNVLIPSSTHNDLVTFATEMVIMISGNSIAKKPGLSLVVVDTLPSH